MTKVVQIIKQKILNLPSLHLCTYKFVCMPLVVSIPLASAKLNYPSSHKEILAVKNGIKRFRLFLKPIQFIVRIDLKHMKGMLSNHKLLEQGNNRVLIWSFWLYFYDLQIEYKPDKDICLTYLLSREAREFNQELVHQNKDIKMFNIEFGSSCRSSQPPHPALEGFHWVLVCKDVQCVIVLSVCLGCQVKSLS
jgi:hypothetical protein